MLRYDNSDFGKKEFCDICQLNKLTDRAFYLCTVRTVHTEKENYNTCLLTFQVCALYAMLYMDV